jgi:hypothetical protein
MEEIIFNRWMEQIGSERGEYMAITVQPTWQQMRKLNVNR